MILTSIAFIMTVILLEYKRYYRNAVIDNSKNKGKVLIIDNPFGETSEEAILKEIFDMESIEDLKKYF